MTRRSKRVEPAARPLVVLVTGEPGSGKTSLGLHVARALRLPFLSRDDVRGGLLATAGLWSNDIRTPTDRDSARATFVEIVETIAGRGVSSVVEFIAFRDDPEATRRIVASADCLVLLATCEDAPTRADRRDRADPLLNREAVLAALGHESIEGYLNDQQRKAVLERMETMPNLPTLSVRTDEGYDPPLEQIVDWIIDHRLRRDRSASQADDRARS